MVRAGGWTETYEQERQAFDRSTGRQVTLRELALPAEMREPERRVRAHGFVREIRILARLQHAGAPTVHAQGSLTSGEPYALLAPVEGRTLRQTLDATPEPKRATLMPALLDVCRAVARAHALNVVHRDLSTQNVRVRPDGSAVVVGWGFARDIDDPEDGPFALHDDLPALGEMILAVLPGGSEGHRHLAWLAGRARQGLGTAEDLGAAIRDAMLGPSAASRRRHLRLLRA